jgi:hypothetical protein
MRNIVIFVLRHIQNDFLGGGPELIIIIKQALIYRWECRLAST